MEEIELTKENENINDSVEEVEKSEVVSSSQNEELEKMVVPKLDLSGVTSDEEFKKHEKKPTPDPEFVNIDNMLQKKSTGRKSRRKKRRKKRVLSKREVIDEYRRDLPVRKSWERSSGSFRSGSKRMNYFKKSSTPGPGDYRVDDQIDKSTFGLSSMKSGTPRFHSTTMREKSKVPSPGTYELKNERNKKLGFFPQSKRFHKKRSKTPSMTSYYPMKSYNALKNTKMKIHSPFKSGNRRFSRVRKKRVPVQYGNGNSRLSKSLDMTGGRFSKSERFKGGIYGRRYSTPPPGCYFSRFFEDFKKTKRSHSFTGERRFKKTKSRKESTPGPGNYLSHEIPESFNKQYRKY